jgi:hypothetical protein
MAGIWFRLGKWENMNTMWQQNKAFGVEIPSIMYKVNQAYV